MKVPEITYSEVFKACDDPLCEDPWTFEIIYDGVYVTWLEYNWLYPQFWQLEKMKTSNKVKKIGYTSKEEAEQARLRHQANYQLYLENFVVLVQFRFEHSHSEPKLFNSIKSAYEYATSHKDEFGNTVTPETRYIKNSLNILTGYQSIPGILIKIVEINN